MLETHCSRRHFLRLSAALAAAAPLNLSLAAAAAKTAVALVPCRSYGPEVKPALAKCFDLVGGVGTLVRNKTVAIKLNLTGGDFGSFLGRPVGETYMTHGDTVMALLALLFEAGASRVRLLESVPIHAPLKSSLGDLGWDLHAFETLGKVEYENTRNLGDGKSYTTLRAPFGGYLFSSVDLNHSYHDTDVMISLAKLKRHTTAGITLSLKNMFGATPVSLYGGEAGSERALDGRGPLHDQRDYPSVRLPGLKSGPIPQDPFVRVPRIVVDICAARPVDLAIVDGITAMNLGEGPWCGRIGPIQRTTPGVLIAGLNPVSTDAVATAVMGYDPRAPRGTHPFDYSENMLLLAEKAGLGTADLANIDVRGTTIEKSRCPYG